jgi:hypothetical protein
MTQQPKMGPAGPEVDENGFPVIVPVLELILVDQQTGDVVVLPLTEEGVEAVKKALAPSSVIVPPPGTKII